MKYFFNPFPREMHHFVFCIDRSPRMEDLIQNSILEFEAFWQSQSFIISFCPLNYSAFQLKASLERLTGVRADHQKIVLRGRRIDKFDKESMEEILRKMNISTKDNSRLRIVLVGTAERDIFQFNPEKEWKEKEDDDEEEEEELLSDSRGEKSGFKSKIFVLNMDVVEVQLNEIIARQEIVTIHPPRLGKKLLVLDLDYTLFDLRGNGGGISQSDAWGFDLNEFKRPFTDELLQNVYSDYDIAIWSQTSWRWLEVKLTELGILTNPSYRISFVLDKNAMLQVESMRNGKKSRANKQTTSISSNHEISGAKKSKVEVSDGSVKKHYVKPLKVIWEKLSDYYGPHNTIHIDDLSRNFALNPGNGLKISPYNNYREQKHCDFELQILCNYLMTVCRESDDLSKLRHRKWKKLLRNIPSRNLTR